MPTALDVKTQCVLSEDPADALPYHPGRPFFLRTGVTPIPFPLQDRTLKRTCRLFAAHSPSDPSAWLILLLNPLSPLAPFGDPHPHLSLSEGELALTELPPCRASLFSTAPDRLTSFVSRVPLRSLPIITERTPWLPPLLIPRRLPSSLRLTQTNSSCLSLWIRLQ